MEVRRMTTDDEIRATHPVMHQLRPHVPADEYLPRVRRMMETDGFRLAAVVNGEGVRAVAGYRFMDLLYCGRTLYVDDLVTDADARSGGYGKLLLDWLKDEARRNDCVELHLDSGTHREDAHRFYFRERLTVSAFHFRIPL
jgi:GNAT superfamily N-acetyltransferase